MDQLSNASQPRAVWRAPRLQSVGDDELLHRLSRLVDRSRDIDADLVAHIAEVDRRRLYARFASPSMFAYCTGVLHLSEAGAYRRITVARASREHPVVLEMLADGRLHLSGLARLVPYLTLENRDRILARAVHRSKRQIEELVAGLAPRPDVASAIRRLPYNAAARPSPGTQPVLGSAAVARTEAAGDGALGCASAAGSLRPAGCVTPSTTGGADALDLNCPRRLVPGPVGPPVTRPAAYDAPRALFEPLAPARYKVQFTASAELKDKLDRLKALMRVPDGDLAAIIDAAVTEKLQRLEARRFGRTSTRAKPTAANAPAAHADREQEARATSSRHVPAAVRRAVSERDGDRCRYVDAQGRRCTGRSGLEFHHRHPFAQGGSHSIQNVSLLCRTHNAYLARIDYGSTAAQPPARHDDLRLWPSGHDGALSPGGLRP